MMFQMVNAKAHCRRSEVWKIRDHADHLVPAWASENEVVSSIMDNDVIGVIGERANAESDHDSSDGYPDQRAVIVAQNSVRCVAHQISHKNEECHYSAPLRAAEQANPRCCTTDADDRHQQNSERSQGLE